MFVPDRVHSLILSLSVSTFFSHIRYGLDYMEVICYFGDSISPAALLPKWSSVIFSSPLDPTIGGMPLAKYGHLDLAERIFLFLIPVLQLHSLVVVHQFFWVCFLLFFSPDVGHHFISWLPLQYILKTSKSQKLFCSYESYFHHIKFLKQTEWQPLVLHFTDILFSDAGLFISQMFYFLM